MSAESLQYDSASVVMAGMGVARTHWKVEGFSSETVLGSDLGFASIAMFFKLCKPIFLQGINPLIKKQS